MKVTGYIVFHLLCLLISSEFLVWLVPSLLRVVVYPHCGLLVNDLTECVRKLMQVSPVWNEQCLAKREGLKAFLTTGR